MGTLRRLMGTGLPSVQITSAQATDVFSSPAAGSTLQPPSELHRSTRTEELRSFLFFTVVMAPLLAVVGVGGFGFLVWMYQLIAGPPAA